jgi:hypothetical protein
MDAETCFGGTDQVKLAQMWPFACRKRQQVGASITQKALDAETCFGGPGQVKLAQMRPFVCRRRQQVGASIARLQ